jgi:hypothetical protein
MNVYEIGPVGLTVPPPAEERLPEPASVELPPDAAPVQDPPPPPLPEGQGALVDETA